MYQSYLDKSTPFMTYRWIGTAALLMVFFVRILVAEGWYIGTLPQKFGRMRRRHVSVVSDWLTTSNSGVLPGHLHAQPLPRLSLPQIRPFA